MLTCWMQWPRMWRARHILERAASTQNVCSIDNSFLGGPLAVNLRQTSRKLTALGEFNPMLNLRALLLVGFEGGP